MALSNKLVEIGVAITLRDQFSNKTHAISGSFNRLMQDIRTAAQTVQQTFGAELAAFGAVAEFGIEAYKDYAAVAKDVFLSTAMLNGAQKEYNELLQQAKDINLEVPLTTKDISSAQRYMAMAGLDKEAITAMTEPVAQLASLFDMQAGGKGGVADLLTNIMATYSLSANQVNEVADDLYTAVTSSNMSLTDLANAIKMAGSEATVSGVSVQETAAAIGLLGDMGIQGTSAGTALANTFRYLRLSLSGQKEKGFKALQAMGLSEKDFYDSEGRLISLHNTYQKFAEAAIRSNMKANDIGEAFYNIFGVRGERNMLLVMQKLMQGEDKMSRLMTKMKFNNGTLGAVSEDYLSSPQGQLDQLTSNIDYLKQSVGSIMSTMATPVLGAFNHMFRAFNELSKNPFMRWLMKGAILFVMVGVVRLVSRMGFSLINTFRVIRESALSMAASGKSFANSVERAMSVMLQLQTAATALPIGGKLPIGMYNGKDAYLKKTQRGLMLSYVGAPGGGRRSTYDPYKQTAFLMGMPLGGRGGPAPRTTPLNPTGVASKASWWQRVIGTSVKTGLAGSGLASGFARFGRGLLSALPGIGMVASGLFLVSDLINMHKDSTDRNSEALENSAQAEQQRQAILEARSKAIHALTAAQLQAVTANNTLIETLDAIGAAMVQGRDINLVINGERVNAIAAQSAIDVTEQAFNAYGSRVSSTLSNMGYS